jgi:hypothetical protein
MIKGPIAVQWYATLCAHCRVVCTQGEIVFLDESDDPQEPDAYVHEECLRVYLAQQEDTPDA